MSGIIKVALLSSFEPTQCGIATYSADLMRSVSSINNRIRYTKFNILSASDTDNRLGYKIRKEILEDYQQALRIINSSEIDIIDIQHEFKLYGNPDGENILTILTNSTKPICTTLHTVSPFLNERKENIFRTMLERSNLLFVFSKEAKEYVNKKYKLDKNRIVAIPHGIPSIPFKLLSDSNRRKEYNSPTVFISTGHMREAKGYEIALQSLASIKKNIPDFLYIILGADHPANPHATSYRFSLYGMIEQLGIKSNVRFIDSYLDTKEIIDYIQSADICLLPYTRQEQSSSGVLPLMIACGRPIVSTPFQFAESIVSKSSGVLSKSFSANAFGESILEMLKNRKQWGSMSEYNHKIAKDWTWDKIGSQYLHAYLNLTNTKI